MPSNIDYLKPQDIVVLLKLLFWRKEYAWTYSELAKDLRISQSEVYAAIKRAELSCLYDPLTRRPQRAALKEFLVHGIKYAFPAKPGEKSKGIATAHSAPPLAKQIVANDSDAYVWPSRLGKKTGFAIKPLYSTVPQAVKGDNGFYEMLALIDALRVGKSREKEIAVKEIEKRVMEA